METRNVIKFEIYLQLARLKLIRVSKKGLWARYHNSAIYLMYVYLLYFRKKIQHVSVFPITSRHDEVTGCWTELGKRWTSLFLVDKTMGTDDLRRSGGAPLPSTNHKPGTMRCRYNLVNYLQNSRERYPIPRAMGVSFVGSDSDDTLPQFLQWCVQTML